MTLWFGEYRVFPFKHGWIVHNTKKPFERGHTHMVEKAGAIGLVRNLQKQKVPKRADDYYLESLIRLTKDEGYGARVGEELTRRRNYKEKMKRLQAEVLPNEIEPRGQGCFANSGYNQSGPQSIGESSEVGHAGITINVNPSYEQIHSARTNPEAISVSFTRQS